MAGDLTPGARLDNAHYFMPITQPLLQFQTQTKVWHWFTKSLAQHEAFGEAYEELSGSVDEFVEILFGREGREAVDVIQLTLSTNTDMAQVESVIAEFKVYLAKLATEYPAATDALNKRDEILGQVDHLLYRLSLN